MAPRKKRFSMRSSTSKEDEARWRDLARQLGGGIEAIELASKKSLFANLQKYANPNHNVSSTRRTGIRSYRHPKANLFRSESDHSDPDALDLEGVGKAVEAALSAHMRAELEHRPKNADFAVPRAPQRQQTIGLTMKTAQIDAAIGNAANTAARRRFSRQTTLGRIMKGKFEPQQDRDCLLYTSPCPRDS